MSDFQWTCSYQSFHSSQLSVVEKCTLAQTECGDYFSTINFFSLVQCNLETIWIFYPLGVILIVLIFKFVFGTIEGYVAPAIIYITEWMKISEALAAVTLLAFANGAGDVMTAVVASGESGGVSYKMHFY